MPDILCCGHCFLYCRVEKFWMLHEILELFPIFFGKTDGTFAFVQHFERSVVCSAGEKFFNVIPDIAAACFTKSKDETGNEDSKRAVSSAMMTS